MLTDTAKVHRRNANLSIAVYKTLLPAMRALRGKAAGGRQVAFSYNRMCSLTIALMVSEFLQGQACQRYKSGCEYAAGGAGGAQGRHACAP